MAVRERLDTKLQYIQFKLNQPDRVWKSRQTSKVANNFRKPTALSSTQDVASLYEWAIITYRTSFSVAAMGQACCYQEPIL